MEETTTTDHHQHQTTSSRLALRHHTGGEIVEVQGGHIVRSTGRKDRHSKVCTAKGPRDRRVRLSAHTAIQFYDVQDRLGYDRPSKAVDWLIKKAKAAIDELAELPAWNPNMGSTTANPNFEQNSARRPPEEPQQPLGILHGGVSIDALAGSSSGRRATDTVMGTDGTDARCDIRNQQRSLQLRNNPSENNSSFMPPSLDSDAFADTIKSLFPMGASAETNSSPMQFRTFPPPDLLSRTGSQSQDLRLSLQSFQDPILLHHDQQQHHRHHHNHQQPPHQSANHQTEHPLFSGATALEFDAPSAAWSEHHTTEISRFQRMVPWNAGGDTGTGVGGFILNSPPTPPLLQPLLGQNQFFSQRGPLQSSNTPPIRAWIDPSSINIATAPAAGHHHHQSLPIHPSSLPGISFASVGGFSGFRIPARIQGEEEEHDGISDKPSSASSDSRH